MDFDFWWAMALLAALLVWSAYDSNRRKPKH